MMYPYIFKIWIFVKMTNCFISKQAINPNI